MSHSVTIKAAPDGPYIVKNLQNFSNRKGAIECKEAMGLCRCGQSANKPYCDGSHKTVGFSSENQLDPDRDRLDTYQGKKITVYDNRSICAHAGICTDGLPSVFHNREGSFVDPDGASVGEIIDIVNRCPSGALSYIIDDESETRLIDEASISIAANGPYELKGKVILLDIGKGEGSSESNCSLCRCGASKNKPFCDGSHWDIKFTDDEN